MIIDNFQKKTALIAILVVILLFDPGSSLANFSQEEAEVIKEKLNLSNFSEFSQFSDKQIRYILNKEISSEEPSGITYGVYISTILNEVDFIDWVSSGKYKNDFYQEFNEIVDQKTNLETYYKKTGQQIVFKAMSRLIGGSTEKAAGLPLSSLKITGKVVDIGKVVFKIGQMKMYDGMWRYFDERRGNASHDEAWEWASVEMNWLYGASELDKSRPWRAKGERDKFVQLEPEFKALWDEWGQHLGLNGLSQEAKDQVQKELREALLVALEEQVKEPQPISFWQKIKNKTKLLVKSSNLIIPKISEVIKKIQSLISQINFFSPASITQTEGARVDFSELEAGEIGESGSSENDREIALRPKAEGLSSNSNDRGQLSFPRDDLPPALTVEDSPLLERRADSRSDENPPSFAPVFPSAPELKSESNSNPKKEIVSKSDPELKAELKLGPKPPFGFPFFVGGGPPSKKESELNSESEVKAGLEPNLESDSNFVAPESTSTESDILADIISPEAPIITSHNSGDFLGVADNLATSTDIFQINLIGGAEASSTILIFINSTSTEPVYLSSTDIFGNWQKEIILQEGVNELRVRCQDMAGNQSQEMVLSLIVDAISPSAITDLSATSGNGRGQVDLTWTTSSSQYIIKYATSSAITDGAWSMALDVSGESLSSATSTTQNFSVDNLIPGQNYYFAIKSKDEVGNLSEISNGVSAIANALADNVVINEVQADSREFVELYNPTSQDIDMTGWYWSYFSSNREWNNPYRNKQFPDGAIIPARGYYLIGLAGFPEENGYLSSDWQVYDSNQLNDKKGSVAIFPWDPTAISAEKVQLGRIDAFGWGEAVDVYESVISLPPNPNGSAERRINGWDTDDNNADFIQNDFATPHNSQNETMTFIPDKTKITQDTAWILEKSPYFLESNLDEYPTVGAEAILTIEAGVTIRGINKYHPSLIIKGGLRAEGAADNLIKFTAATTTPEIGDWSGIVFDNSSGTDSILEYAVFEYGGHQVDYQDFQAGAMVMIDNSQVVIKNSTFGQSQNNGAYLINSIASFSDCLFENNSVGLTISGSFSQPIIDNCHFENNDDMGLVIINQSSPSIINNNFTANTWAVYLESAYPNFGGNWVADNDLNGIVVDQNSVFSKDAAWSADLPFILFSDSDNIPTVAFGASLTLEPGVVIKVNDEDNTTLLVEGNLIAQGASSTPIIFTSIKDDQYGGDANNDGGESRPAMDDWRDIKFAEDSEGSLDWIIFRYGYQVDQVLDVNDLADVDIGDNIIYEPRLGGGLLSF